MSKLRVYMVAKDLGIDNKSLVSLFQTLGVDDVRNHMSAVGLDQVERVKRHLSKHGGDASKVEERVKPGGGGVIIRRGKRKAAPAEESKTAAPRATTIRRSKPEPAKPVAAPSSPQAAPVAEAPAAAPEPPASAAAPAPAPAAPPSAPSAAAPSAPPAPQEKKEAAAPTAEATKPVAEASAPAASPVPSKPEETLPAEKEVQSAPAAAAKPAPAPRAPAVPLPLEKKVEEVPAAKVAAPPASAPAAAAPPPPAPAEPQAEKAPTSAGVPATTRTGAAPAPRAAATPARPAAPAPAPAPVVSRPKTGIDVWQGRPGVPMPQQPRGSLPPRRVQYDAKAGGGGRRGPMMGGGGRMRGGPRRGIGSLGARKSGGAPVTQERNAHKKVVKIEGSVALQSLASKIQVKAGELLMKLMSLGVSGININSTLDPDTAKIVGGEFGWSVEDVAVSEDDAIAAAQEVVEEDEDRVPRPPVVTVMGHVDHGKTSLLDKIRKSTVAGGEAGGITQHIGAYSVKTERGRVTFLDTPGHAAFSAMRARGAKATDIVVIVVAADDGVMPQTKEAVAHAKEASCPIVVAVNKIDKPDSQPERARRELSEIGLVPEEWGGDTLFCEVSALTGDGIPVLLDNILLQAEVLDLRANPKRFARGTVIEAKLDRGRGPVATVLVTEGTLRKGDGIIAGNAFGKVRAMLDDSGRNVSEAGPAVPVAVIGLNEVPNAGDAVDAMKNAKSAQEIAAQRKTKSVELNRGARATMSLEDWALGISQADQQDLKLIVKADVQGSVEALRAALEEMSVAKVKVSVVHAGVGSITEGDVNLAVAAKAVIIGFNVRPAGKAGLLAVKEDIEIRQYSIIYEALDAIKLTMEGMLVPTLVEEAIGKAEIRKIFKVTKSGVVAGCMVTSGMVRRNSLIRLQRDNAQLWEGKLDALKRFKDDAKEVREGFDCGVSFTGHTDVQEGDIIAAFEMKEVRPTL